MRTRIVTVLLGAALAFLLVTHPVVAEAARKVTGRDIKNNSVTSADIRNNNLTGVDVKNRSLTGKDVKNNSIGSGQIRNGSVGAADLAADAVPQTGVVAVRRFGGGFSQSMPASGTLYFAGETVTVAVDGQQLLLGSGSMTVNAVTTGDDTDVALCYHLVGSLSSPAPLGDAIMIDVDLLENDNALSADAAEVLPAGTYEVGMCVAPWGGLSSTGETSGWVQVIQGVGDPGPVTFRPGAARRSADADR